MSFINKVKNFFYEEIEEDDEEFERREALKREEKLRKREEKEKRKIEFEKPKAKENVTVNNDLSERELFKSEKTFNFPMDLGDDIFDIADTMPSKVNQEESRNKVKEEKNIYARSSIRSSVSPVKKEEPKEEPKKFRPTPVVSPIYGILDKNYTVEDVVDKNLSKTKEFSLEKKIVDFDTVRNRAYKELDEEIEKTLTNEKSIFYNLDEEEVKEENNDTIDDYIEESYDKNENSEKEDVIITYESEELKEDPEEIEENVEEVEDFQTPDVEIPKIKKKGRKKEQIPEEKEEVGEKEDLFNLIDNMYNDEEDEEEEE